MNLTRKQKALYSAMALWVVFLLGFLAGWGIANVLLGILYLIGWVMALRYTNPRVRHLPPSERFGLGSGGAVQTRPRPVRPGAPVEDEPPSVVVPDDPEEQARLAAARAEREAERAEARRRRDAAKEAEKDRKRLARDEAEAERQAEIDTRAERERLEAEGRARREADELELRQAEEQAAREAEDLARREAEALAARQTERQALERQQAERQEAERQEAERHEAEARRAAESRDEERRQAAIDAERRQAELETRREAEEEAERRAEEQARRAEEAAARAAAAEPAVIDEEAVQSDQDILAASGVAALDRGATDADDETRRTAALLDKVQARLRDYE